MDAEYYQGKEKNGLVPYKNKFYYCNASQTNIDSSSGIGYVVSNNELGLFSEKEYHIETYDGFSSVIPLKNYKGS